jgi:TonB-linked SusC/RagA family outer membrane protein
MKKELQKCFFSSKHLIKLFRIMKLALLLTVIAVINLTAATYSQEKKLNVNLSTATIGKVFQAIEEQSDFNIFYKDNQINKNIEVNLNMKNATVNEILDKAFKNTHLSYTVLNKIIVISDKGMAKFQVTGFVYSNTDHSPIVGATILEKGTQNATITDLNGKFKIDVKSSDATLIVSFMGFETSEVRVNGSSKVDINLKEKANLLNEVVVVGYGTQDRRKLTSAVTTASGEELTKRAATDPETLLQGQLPGLQVVQNSGEPGGEGVTMLIRGISTFSGAGNNPLVIIDGLPGSLTALNPNDIESVSLLKDAASAAIYGSRGANGVIVITTKAGKAGKFSLSYNYSMGISNPTSLPNIVTNSAEYMTLSNEAYINSGRAPLYTQAQIDLYANATDRVKYPNHNWLNDIFQTAITQNHYLSMSGGFDKTNFKLGVGITDQPGTMIGFEFKKYTLDLNLSSKVNKRITIGTTFQMRYSYKLAPEDGATDLFLSALAQSPLYPAEYNGKWIKRAYSNEQGNKNPVAIVDEDIRTRTSDYYMQGSLFANVDLFKGLTWENKLGTNLDYSKYNDFRPVVQQYYYSDMSSAGILDDGTPGLNVGTNDNVYTIMYSQLDYKQLFGNHNFSAIGGVSQEHNKGSYMDASRLQYTSNLLRELNAGPTSGMTNDGTSNEWAISSLYGNFNYDYKDKYLLGTSVRYDGTSRLPKDTRWGLFYSFSGAWRISKENFFKNVSWVNDLKLRGSWGELGNQNIGNYPYQPTLASSAYAFASSVSSGYTANTLVDPSLTWETTRVTDFGLDLKAFNNKLTFTADWFNKYTYDILRGSQVPLWLGLNAPTINDGAVRNKGLELNVQYTDNITKDLSFTIGGSFQKYKNILEKYGKTEIGSNTIREEGQPLDSYYMYVWDGIFQSQTEIDASAKQPVTPTPGDLKIKDVNKDGVIDAKDRVLVNGKYPSYQYTINMDLKWKNFDVSAMLYSSQGQKIYVNGWGIEPFRQGSVPTTDWLNAWTSTNHTNSMPKIYLADGYPAVQNYPSTYFLKDASYIRLKNVQIGYTIPVRIINMLKIQSVRIYCAADNVFTISKFPGLDPERTGDGTYVNYPQNKTFTIGATIQF